VDLLDLTVLSVRTIGKHKLRSALTVLGVVIGIAAVTTMVSIGQGATLLIQNEFKNLGTNVLIIFPASNEQGGVRQDRVMTLTQEDADAISKECPSITAVTCYVGATGQVIGGNANWKPSEMYGVGPEFPKVHNWGLAQGRFFTDQDVAGANKVCVLGYTVVAHLFPEQDPIGQQVRVKNIPFTIIGVLSKRGSNLFGQDQDNILLVPYTTARKRLQNSAFNNVDIIVVSARSEGVTSQAQKEITSLLRERHRIPPGSKPDFEVNDTANVMKVLNIILGSMTAMLAAIAAISLVVGGVGIMNIMLVSVTERTREIGIRMALGARPRDILRQFLVEAAVLSSIGGIFGILLGIGASAGLTAIINLVLPTSNWPFVVSIPATIIALVFAASVGIFFGFYPARRASRLDPIESLRYD
jgi:putative ABC transport system permease protein